MKAIVTSILVLGLVSAVRADVLILDDFDNSDLGTGGINGGFSVVDNDTAKPGTADETGTVASLTDGQNENIYGIVSAANFSLAGYTSATTTWTVTQYSIKNKTSYMAFTWQQDAGYDSTPDLQVIIDLETGELSLQAANEDILGSVDIDAAFGTNDSSFVLTSIFDSDGFTILGTGSLKDVTLNPVNISATWVSSGRSYTDVFSENYHLGVLVNAKGSGGLEAEIDSVRMEAIPEPAVISLIGIFGGGMIFCHRLSNRRKKNAGGA